VSQGSAAPNGAPPTLCARTERPSSSIHPGRLDFHARGSREFFDIDLRQALDRPADLFGERYRDVLELIRASVAHGAR
jgi:hypothetical protein